MERKIHYNTVTAWLSRILLDLSNYTETPVSNQSYSVQDSVTSCCRVYKAPSHIFRLRSPKREHAGLGKS